MKESIPQTEEVAIEVTNHELQNADKEIDNYITTSIEEDIKKDQEAAKKLEGELVFILEEKEKSLAEVETNKEKLNTTNETSKTTETKPVDTEKKKEENNKAADKKEDKKPEKKDDKKGGNKKDGKFKKFFKKLGMGIGIGVAGFFGAMEYFSDLIHGKSEKKDDKKK